MSRYDQEASEAANPPDATSSVNYEAELQAAALAEQAQAAEAEEATESSAPRLAESTVNTGNVIGAVLFGGPKAPAEEEDAPK
jgi:hypothetical protein